MEPVLKHGKIPKDYAHKFMKFFSLLLIFLRKNQISGNNPVLTQILKDYHQPKLNGVYILLKFDKPNDAFTKAVNCFASCKGFRKTLKLWKMPKYWNLKDFGASYKHTTIYTENPVKKMFWEKLKNQGKLDKTPKHWYLFKLILYAFWEIVSTIYLDEDGIIRVGGRLDKNLNNECKHLKVLPKSSSISKLAIVWCHKKTGHIRRGITLNKI